MSQYDHDHYNKRLKGFSRSLRKDMTKSEACLWKYALSRRQIKGYQFKRQRPVDQYIADFMCQPLMLIIELDGFTHIFPEVASNDEVRQQRLEELGYRVIRFEDEEVLNDIDQVIRVIEYAMEEQEDALGLPRQLLD